MKPRVPVAKLSEENIVIVAFVDGLSFFITYDQETWVSKKAPVRALLYYVATGLESMALWIKRAMIPRNGDGRVK